MYKGKNIFKPQKNENIKNIVKIESGFKHTVFISKDKDVYVAGSNKIGQIGLLNQDDKNDL